MCVNSWKTRKSQKLLRPPRTLLNSCYVTAVQRVSKLRGLRVLDSKVAQEVTINIEHWVL